MKNSGKRKLFYFSLVYCFGPLFRYKPVLQKFKAHLQVILETTILHISLIVVTDFYSRISMLMDGSKIKCHSV